MEKGESLCKVCGDKASGKHYGVPSCDGCRGFFKRSIRRGLAYHCKESGCCVVDVSRRNQCQACRFKKCLNVNMKREAVQHERAPRTPLPAPQCTARRYPFGVPLAGTPTAMDLSGYHLLYPQPQLPFFKPPMSLGFFNNYCAGFPPNLLSHDACSMLRLPRLTSLADPGKCSEVPRATSVADDEVTSSEEVSESSHETPAKCQSLLELPLTAPGPENVYECAAKILFLTVKWARSIPSFLQLSSHDQTLLLEESWSDLFVLSAGEWVLPIDKDYLLREVDTSRERRAVFEKGIHRLQETVSRFMTMRLDHTEFSCLKALTLFKPETQELEQRTHVEYLQEQGHAMLQEHCSRPDTPKARFGKLLLLLPTVHGLSRDLLEEMLFRKTIGNISIERVLSDMLRSGPG